VRVLLLSTHPPVRGVLQAIASHGIEALAISDVRPDSGEPSTSAVYVSARGARDNPVDLRWSRRGLRAAMRDVRPDVLHITGDPWTPTAEAGAAAARALRIPYVLVGMSSRGEPHSLTGRWQAERIRRDAAALGGISRPALDHLLRSAMADDARPRAVLPAGGVAIPALPPSRAVRDTVTFGLVGRLVPERGADLLLEALNTAYGSWRLVIAGTGPAHEAIEQQAQRLGLAARLQWLGVVPRDQLAAIWPQIDVLVAPSRSTADWVEPTGQAVLEAMAHGVAPIVSRCGALPDVVGDAGLIIDEGDVPALSRAVQGFVEDPVRCVTLGGEARERVLERFTDAAAAIRMFELWQRVAGASGGSATSNVSAGG
jgi:glycosyltransferase involved in cell wall biosynthesis